MIVLLPTSHVARKSIEAIERAIESLRPDAVAVELDMDRYIALSRGYESRIEFNAAWPILYIMKQIQQAIGRKAGIMPGRDMLEAVKNARNKGLPVMLIDQHISITIGKIAKISWTEKLKLLGFIAYSVLLSPFSGDSIDLSKLPEGRLIEKAQLTLRIHFPQLNKALVEERDLHMARMLEEQAQKHKNILAVVGAGHIQGMKEMLRKRHKVQIYRY
ncbi:MAG: TraB/GumN family protein [Candidatus Aenigmarchaeota archaeon]|nr:TraB/GumN family protein [Candidatus Aenigmarchaeota archaeon]